MHVASVSNVSASSNASSIASPHGLQLHHHHHHHPHHPHHHPQQPRRHSRSNSLSSASVVTVKRPGSLSSSSTSARSSAVPTRPHSPDGDADVLRRPRNLSRDPTHKRRKSVATNPYDQPAAGDDGLTAVNRWSHSTNSSVTSLQNAYRKRSSSGAVLSQLAAQQYSSPGPQRKPVPARTSSLLRTSRPSSPTASATTSSPKPHARRFDSSLTALPPLHTTPALTDPNDTESPPATTIATPSTQSSYMPSDYFGVDGSTSPRTIANAKQRPFAVRTGTAPAAASGQSHYRGFSSDAQDTSKSSSEAAADGEQRPAAKTTDTSSQSPRRPRPRERSEKDKKTMLSKALQKANTAVLLDNAQNYEGALEAYSDACHLLQQVMERTSGDDDKRKLDAIRVTYRNRIDELEQMIPSSPDTAEEKTLPARPMSDDTMNSSPVISPIGTALSPFDGAGSPRESTDSLRRPPFRHPPSIDMTPTGTKGHDVPTLSYPKRSRDSFFSRTMAAVEDTARSHGGDYDLDGPTVAGAEAKTPTDARGLRTLRRTSVHLSPPDQERYVPAPLSPRRMSPPALSADPPPPPPPNYLPREPAVVTHAEDEAGRNRTESNASVSWLDTIDESASSRSSSRHSISSQRGVRRKHIKAALGESDPDFDAAFDAAVEAAYNEGFEPDLGAREKRLTAYRRPRRQESDDLHVHVHEPESAAPLEPISTLDLNYEDEEEERILDEITQDFSHGFNFDLRSKSALPRQSDSSGYSRNTWQSQTSVDRTTAASSLSTVAEDGLSSHFSKNPHLPAALTLRPDASSAAMPQSAPPKAALPKIPTAPPKTAPSVRSRRLSGQTSKALKIDTAPLSDARKRASTFHHVRSPFKEEEEEEEETTTVDPSLSTSDGASGEPTQPALSSAPHEHALGRKASQDLLSAATSGDEKHRPATAAIPGYRPSYEAEVIDIRGRRPPALKKNKSTLSLREHTEHTLLLASPELGPSPMVMTPMSSTFLTLAAKRQQNSLTSQRATLPSFGNTPMDGQYGGGIYLFDTSLSATQAPMSPRSPAAAPQPNALEPCPESLLLRPFWLMRALASTLIHPRGGFITTKMFVPREVWQTRGVKLKWIEDKVANCDLLTAALGRLGGVDTYDADAVMEELQSFEEVMERVQAVLAKKLGNDVGVQGAAGMFRDAGPTSTVSAGGGGSSTTPTTTTTVAGSDADKAAKSHSGKSYLTSWRKLRSKSSGAPLSTGGGGHHHPVPGKPTDPQHHHHKDQHTMASVPMTSFVPVERRGNKRDPRNTLFEGPNKEYMESLARLFDGVQILDQIARQVEDPGLKHSSPTHVGLELSIRHAAEFFAFYVCRFALADLGTLIDKFVKRGSEWVLA